MQESSIRLPNAPRAPISLPTTVTLFRLCESPRPLRLCIYLFLSVFSVPSVVNSFSSA